MAKLKITETQLMLLDLALATAIKFLMGEYDRIKNATEEELKDLRKNAEKKFKESLERLKNQK